MSDNTAQQKDEGGSFWDEKKEDSWNSSSASSKKVNSAVDRILDDFGSMFQIKVSDNVHENVRSIGARAE